MFFPVITKNSNCEMFQLRILGSLKNPIFRWGGGGSGGGEGFTKNQYRARGLPKKGAWAVCRFKAAVLEAWQKREGDVFERKG